MLQAKIDSEKVDWLEEGYNYLAIGNSIISHLLTDYCRNKDCVMAASEVNKDYIHLLANFFPKKQKVFALNFSAWEILSYDRADTLIVLDKYLNDRIDLVTIRLEENALDITTFESDFVELIGYVKNNAPNAQITVIDDFWENDDRSHKEKNAAKECEVDFVSLNEIKGK